MNWVNVGRGKRSECSRYYTSPTTALDDGPWDVWRLGKPQARQLPGAPFTSLELAKNAALVDLDKNPDPPAGPPTRFGP